MSSEKLGHNNNVLKGDLGGGFNILTGSTGEQTDLGIARRFGGAAAAYSLRDIGAMNGRVVKARRDVGETSDPEEDFSASQVQSGALEDYINGKLESTLPADVATAAAAYSLRKVKATYSGDAVRIRRSSDDVEVDVAFDSDNKVSASSAITNIAEQGGEIGSTTATTLGDFINDTDAFVHTWYNQSGDGSNGATQSTSTKQPKIASSGTLLDHLLFDGTDDFLADTNATFEGALTLACLSEKAADGLYPISAARQGVTNRFFGIQEQTSASAFIPRNNASGATVTVTASGNTRLTFARTNADTDQAVASMGRALSTGTNDYGNTPTASLINHFVIGALTTGGGGTPDLGTWNGKIFEAIGYQTDETDNKFKIESNINNYYGLYNDADELVADFAKSGLATISNASKDGFTGQTTDGNDAYFGVELNDKVASADIIYISFNSTKALSSGVGLRETIAGSLAQASITSVSVGFNSIALTSNNNDAKFISFVDDTDTSFTISDFKVSRIARNGFVETWYDQSGNGNHLSNSTATEQPNIVINGGLVKAESGQPCLNFQNNVLFTSGTSPLNGVANAYFSVFSMKSSAAGGEIFRNGSTRNANIVYSSGNTSLYHYYSDGSSLPNVQKTGQGGTNLRIDQFLLTGDRDSDSLGVAIDNGSFTTANMTGLSTDAITGNLFIGARNSNPASNDFEGKLAEFIGFNADKSSDRESIRDELNLHYKTF